MANFDFDQGTADYLDGHFAGEALRGAVLDAVDMGYDGEVTVSVAGDLMCSFSVPGGVLAAFLLADEVVVVDCRDGFVLAHAFDPEARRTSWDGAGGVEGWTLPWSEDAFADRLRSALGLDRYARSVDMA